VAAPVVAWTALLTVASTAFSAAAVAATAALTVACTSGVEVVAGAADVSQLLMKRIVRTREMIIKECFFIGPPGKKCTRFRMRMELILG
jgi:hypothetical protein